MSTEVRTNTDFIRFFQEQVEATPDRCAIYTIQKQVSFAALNRDANRLAHHLIERRGAKSEPVVVLIDDEILYATAFFAAIKSGRFFVALDPTLPLPRLQHYIDELACEVLLCEAATRPTASRLLGDEFIVEADRVLAGHGADGDPAVSVHADDIAFISYTSGSTNRPKGVIMPHHSVRALEAYKKQMPCDTVRRLCVPLTKGTTHSVSSVLYTIMMGGTWYPYDINDRGIGELPRWLDEHDVNALTCTPGVFRALCEAAAGHPITAVREVTLGGDALTAADLAAFQRTFARPAKLTSYYGATEFGGVSYSEFNHDSVARGPLLTAGKPYGDVWIEAPDEQGCGELWVRTPHLSPGYWKNPELTAYHFVPDPQNPGQRIYRTGDIGRFDENGELMVLGRNDSRTKINGFGVSPVEVEGALLSVPGIREATVVAARDNANEPHLIAFVSATSGSESTWKEQLQALVPAYMVPAAIIPLDQLPRTQGGHKPDRVYLAGVAHDLVRQGGHRGRVASLQTYTPPINPLEGQLVMLWEEMLGVEPIGATRISSRWAATRCWPRACCLGPSSRWAFVFRFRFCISTPPCGGWLAPWARIPRALPSRSPRCRQDAASRPCSSATATSAAAASTVAGSPPSSAPIDRSSRSIRTASTVARCRARSKRWRASAWTRSNGCVHKASYTWRVIATAVISPGKWLTSSRSVGAPWAPSCCSTRHARSASRAGSAGAAPS